MTDIQIHGTHCTHLDLVQEVSPSAQVCEECRAQGDEWVHLRLCLICGHVGCCNDSRNKHAMKHFLATDHPMIRSFEPGEEWMWCFVDQVFVQGPDVAVTKEFLRRLPLFESLLDEDLDLLYRMAEPIFVPAGQLLMEEGTPGDALYVVLDGELEVTKRTRGQDIVLAVRGEGEYVGEMALLDDAPRTASVRTVRDSHFLVISQATFRTLLSHSPTASLAVLRTVTARLRTNESMLMQQEKMAALGTLAAGLAHELNNPAAAIRRSSTHLQDALDEWESLLPALSRLNLTPEQLEAVRSLRSEAERRTAEPGMVNPLAASDREEEVLTWLEDHDVSDAWKTAPLLAVSGWEGEMLDRVADIFPADRVQVVVCWLAASSSARSLLAELGTSAESISHIVKAVKTYSYLDQAPVQDVDVHESLENTLVILRHKLKEGVRVVREYAADLPHIEAYGSDLNQVWTNLIDNAIDAMQGRGELLLRTYAGDREVTVEIKDNGPGIPPEIQQQIFDPFFTTKPMGVGSGLGLHIAYNIVVLKHHGHIGVDSRPGSTCFRVVLPVRLERS